MREYKNVVDVKWLCCSLLFLCLSEAEAGNERNPRPIEAELAAGAMSMELPSFRYAIDGGSRSTLTTIDASDPDLVSSFSIGIPVGANSGDSLDSPLVSSIAISASHFRTSASSWDKATPALPFGSFWIPTLDGAQILSMPPTPPARAKLDVELSRIELSFKPASQFSAGGWLITPSFGGFYERLDQDFSHSFDVLFASSGGNVSAVPQTLQEDLKTDFLGIRTMMTGSMAITENVSLDVSPSVSIVYSNTKFDGVQQFPSLPLVVRAEDDDESFSLRAGVSVNVAYKFRLIEVGFRVGVDYWGFAPQVINPMQVGDSAAHIDSDDALVTKGLLFLKAEF